MTWWLMALAWAASFPAYIMLYSAYKLRRCPGRFQFYLVNGLMRLVFWTMLMISVTIPAEDPSNFLFFTGLIGLLVALLFTDRLSRKAPNIEAKDLQEPEECRRAEQNLLRWKPWW